MVMHRSKVKEVIIPFVGQNMQRDTVAGAFFKIMCASIKGGAKRGLSTYIEYLLGIGKRQNSKDLKSFHTFLMETGKSKSSSVAIKKEFYARGFQINTVETIRYWEKNFTKTCTAPSVFIIGTEEGTMFLASFLKSSPYITNNQ